MTEIQATLLEIPELEGMTREELIQEAILITVGLVKEYLPSYPVEQIIQ